MPLSYVFFGTPESCALVLTALLEAGRPPLAVVCQPDRPGGRGRRVEAPPAKRWARQCRVEVLQPERCREPTFLQRVREFNPDLGLVFAFGQLLPEELLRIPPRGFINIHPSLLPRYRGAAPVQWTLINGDEQAGVSIIEVTPRLDDGDVLLQQAVLVDEHENAVELGERLAVLGAGLIVRALDLLERATAAAVPQDRNRVVWAPALTKEDSRIDWSRDAWSIHNRIRGVQPWPGAIARLGDRFLKIHRAAPDPRPSPGAAPGQVVAARGEDLLVGTGDGLLRLLEVQLEGKKRMPAREFLRGRALQAGERLG